MPLMRSGFHLHFLFPRRSPYWPFPAIFLHRTVKLIVSPVPAVAASENELERVVLDVQETVSVPLRNLQPENRFPLSVQEDGISPVMDSSAVHPKKLLFIFCADDGICTSFRLTQPLQIFESSFALSGIWTDARAIQP